jgi:hypothetical protein
MFWSEGQDKKKITSGLHREIPFLKNFFTIKLVTKPAAILHRLDRTFDPPTS